MDNCIFCKIVNGEIPCYKIYETEKYLAFLDIASFEDGHTLVIPKTHRRFVWDDPDFGEYMEVAKKIANHYRGLGMEFVDSLTLGRMVPHAHFHLIPHNGVGGDWEKAIAGLDELTFDEARRLTSEKAAKILAKFKM